MAAVRGDVSSGGSSNTRRAAYLPPLHCTGEPASASCVSPGSTAACSKASRAAACYASDAKPVPEVEASAGKNRNMPLAISGTGGRGESYDSRQASSYRGVPLTHSHPASPSPGTCVGGEYHEPHGGDDACSSITRRLKKLRGRLPTRADFTKPSSALQNIRLQTTGHPFLLDRIGSVSDWRFTKARGKEDEVYDQNNKQTDNVSSRISSALNRNFDSNGAFEGSNCSPIFMKPSGTPQNIRLQTPRHHSLLDRRVEGANQVPRRSIYKAAPARLIHQSPSHSRHQHVKANTDCIDPKVSEGKYEVNEQDWQMDTMPSHASSARDWNFEFDVAFEGRNHSAHLVKPSAMLRNIRVQIPRHPSLLDRRDNYHQHVGALDAINEQRLPKEKLQGRLPTSADFTLHPPPLYKCEVCRKGTAFCKLKCCLLMVCECCGCTCEPAEAKEDQKLLQCLTGKVSRKGRRLNSRWTYVIISLLLIGYVPSVTGFQRFRSLDMAADELGVHPILWQMEAQLEAEMVRRNQILGWTVGVILLSLFILGEIVQNRRHGRIPPPPAADNGHLAALDDEAKTGMIAIVISTMFAIFIVILIMRTLLRRG